MKKIVLVLFATMFACVVVFASPNTDQLSKPEVVEMEQNNTDGFERIALQDLPHPVLRALGNLPLLEECTFEAAYISRDSGVPIYKIEIMFPDHTTDYVFMDELGELLAEE